MKNCQKTTTTPPDADNPLTMQKRFLLLAVAIVAVLSLATPARVHAQSSPALLLKPWEAAGAAETLTEGMIAQQGHVQSNGNHFQFSDVESDGRFRLFPGKEASPRFGYDVTFINANTSQPNFPHQLLDSSVGFGSFLGISNGWVFGAQAGIGYAGSSPFGEGRGWYARGSFIVAKKFDEQNALGVGLDYDGHRSYLPDTPLPGFAFSHTFDPHWDMVIGAPLSSIIWKPNDQWRFYLDWLLLSDLDFNVVYKVTKQFDLFASFETRRDQFWIHELGDHNRLLYLQRRVEGGLSWEPKKDLRFTAVIGYAFSTDFRFGWDYRQTSPYLYASNEPYIRFGMDFKF
ncbi:MAG TPA: DUF6268 family outer membrane beta-barrel protein [Tepidisphaeraceae bacterium]